jgi:DNA-binding MarR family transcriptional regulator
MSEQYPEDIDYIEKALHRIMRRLGKEDPSSPLMQLPLAQLRLANALFCSDATLGESMGRLRDKLGAGQSALTQTADRLIAHELAERLNDPEDRRVVRIRLTDKGRFWLEELKELRRKRISEVLDYLDEDKRIQFINSVQVLDKIVSEVHHAAKITSASPEKPLVKKISETGTVDNDPEIELLHTLINKNDLEKMRQSDGSD